jgi:hypothetical protein
MTAPTIATLVAQTGDLAGNWSWTVWLLIPVVLIAAVVTALCLGPGGDPPRAKGATGGVSRYLERTAAKEDDR